MQYNNNNSNILTELIFLDSLITRNLFLNGIYSFMNNNSNSFIPQIYSYNSFPILKKDVFTVSNNKETGSESVSSSESTKLFTNSENSSSLIKEEIYFVNKKRYRERKARKDNKDNIRKKIKRGFFNHALVKKLNDKLRSIGSKKYFERFPQNFASDVDRKRNNGILNISLKEIFEKKELFIHENERGLSNYFHNLTVVESREILENEEFKKILNKTFSELYEEYINSDEFKNDEINRLKKKNGAEYISKYIYLAKTLIEFFSKCN